MRKLILGLSFICCHFTLSVAQNPFVQTWFTTDPAPMVHDGTMYVYTGRLLLDAGVAHLLFAGHG